MIVLPFFFFKVMPPFINFSKFSFVCSIISKNSEYLPAIITGVMALIHLQKVYGPYTCKKFSFRYLKKKRLTSLGGSDAPYEWRPGGCGFNPAEVGNILSWTLIMKYFIRMNAHNTGSCEIMCTILVNHIDQACPVNVWLGKLTALDMTSLGWLGRKTSTQKKSIDILYTGIKSKNV